MSMLRDVTTGFWIIAYHAVDLTSAWRRFNNAMFVGGKGLPQNKIKEIK